MAGSCQKQLSQRLVLAYQSKLYPVYYHVYGWGPLSIVQVQGMKESRNNRSMFSVLLKIFPVNFENV